MERADTADMSRECQTFQAWGHPKLTLRSEMPIMAALQVLEFRNHVLSLAVTSASARFESTSD
jgi:hypothetical protein